MQLAPSQPVTIDPFHLPGLDRKSLLQGDFVLVSRIPVRSSATDPGALRSFFATRGRSHRAKPPSTSIHAAMSIVDREPRVNAPRNRLSCRTRPPRRTGRGRPPPPASRGRGARPRLLTPRIPARNSATDPGALRSFFAARGRSHRAKPPSTSIHVPMSNSGSRTPCQHAAGPRVHVRFVRTVRRLWRLAAPRSPRSGH